MIDKRFCSHKSIYYRSNCCDLILYAKDWQLHLYCDSLGFDCSYRWMVDVNVFGSLIPVRYHFCTYSEAEQWMTQNRLTVTSRTFDDFQAL